MVQHGTGQVLQTFSIITTEANEMMAEIHNSGKRMPAILSRSDEKKWIDLSLSEEKAVSLLKPCPEGQLKAHTIGPLVNNRIIDRNIPEIIQPYKYKSGDLLF